jgi:leader peptidase (prepilin peptidase)/N-methyltransferase
VTPALLELPVPAPAAGTAGTALLLSAVLAAGLVAGLLLDRGAERIVAARGLSAAPRFRGRSALAAIVTALLSAAVVAVHRGDAAELVLGLVLVAFLVPISLIDADQRIIPDRLTVPAALLAVALGTALDPGGEPERLLAGAVAGAALAVPAIVHPAGMGMGDAKLVAVLGLFLGAAVAPAFAAAFLAGAVTGVTLMARKGVAVGRKTPIAFGPYLALGAVVGVLAGDELVDLYLRAF